VKQILHAIHIHAAPSRVYGALTSGSDLARWWTTKVEIGERFDGVIRFTFAGNFHTQMRQTHLERNRRVEWLCVDGHANWQGNTFVFEGRTEWRSAAAVYAALRAGAVERGMRHLQLQLGVLPQ
jgi:uncharacterized protein YndB with AHSA1/START domain